VLENPSPAFADLLTRARSVIFCRSSPKEKAVIVRFVKRQLGLIVLAIGDGGNDVGMIEEANIGVGIIGKEGNSAAAVSDFSIGQFRFLDRLVLHHGRWFYWRLSYFFVFFGLKNMAVSVGIFFYLWDCAFSGTLVFT
jgi:P-type E1-E2 ATPase